MPARLSLVAVPIGDPDDITLRALRTLREADVVAAEDTRVTRALLAHHGITARLVSYHDHNEADRAEELLARIQAGAHVALVSDAGTPLVNDPGYRLVRACVQAGVKVDVLPGACAAVAALVGSGLPVDRFAFGGFVPRDAGARDALFDALGSLDLTLVLYESPLRLAETLDAIARRWPDRRVVAARNLTKEWEQWLRGTASEVRTALGEETRGEVVLLLAPAAPEADDAAADALIDALLAEGRTAKDVRDAVAEATGLPRREIYRRVLTRRSGPTRR